MMESFVKVCVQVRMHHKWQDATKNRGYLALAHPHNFEIKIEIQVFEDDRELEFHDVQDALNAKMQEAADIEMYELDSCESIAKDILEWLKAKYGVNRKTTVEVWEDKDCGGKVKYIPKVPTT